MPRPRHNLHEPGRRRALARRVARARRETLRIIRRLAIDHPCREIRLAQPVELHQHQRAELRSDRDPQEEKRGGDKGALTHPPVNEGNCLACHSAHASDNVQLINKSSTVELCGTCHDWLKHASHPMGEKVTDRRNKNLTIQCLSCHNAHGTDYKIMILRPTVSEMCTQCHVEYRR